MSFFLFLIATTAGVACTRLPAGCEGRADCGPEKSDDGGSAGGGSALAGAAPVLVGEAWSVGGQSSAAGGAPLGGEGGDRPEGGDGAGGTSVVEPGLGVTGPAALRMRQSTSIELPVRIERKGRFEGLVQVNLSGLPAGVIGSSVVLSGSETETSLQLMAADDADAGGPFSIQLEAESLDGSLASEASLELIVAGKSGALDDDFHGTGVLFSTSSQPIGMGLDSAGRIYLASNFTDGSVKHGSLERSSRNGEWEAAPLFEPASKGQFGTDLTVSAIGEAGVWLGVRGYLVDGLASTGLLRLGLDGRPVHGFGVNGFRPTAAEPWSILLRDDGGAYVGADKSLWAISDNGLDDSEFELYSGDCVQALGSTSQGLLLGCLSEDGTDILIERIRADGSLDESFGARGKVELETDDYLPLLSSLLESEAGTVYGTYDSILFKLGSDGMIDSNFGEQGKVNLNGFVAPQEMITIHGGLLLFNTYRGNVALNKLDFGGHIEPTFAQKGTLDLTDYLGALDINSAAVTIHSIVEDKAFGRLLIAAEDGKHAFILRFWL